MPSLHQFFSSVIILLVCCTACRQSEIKPNTDQHDQPIRTQTNINYGSALNYRGEENDLFLDVYQPSNGKQNPSLLLIHSGDLMQGEKDEWKELAQELAKKQITTISITYRLGRGSSGELCNGDAYSIGQSLYRAVQDAHAAFRYLVKNATDFGIDTSQLYAGGAGVGGVTAMALGFTRERDFKKLFPTIINDLGSINQSGNQITTPFKLKGLIHWNGAWLTESAADVENILPVMGFLNTNDSIIPEFKGPFQKCSNFPMLFGPRFIHEKMLAFNTSAILHRRVGTTDGLDDSYYYSSNIACFIKDVKAGKQSKEILTNHVSVCP